MKSLFSVLLICCALVGCKGVEKASEGSPNWFSLKSCSDRSVLYTSFRESDGTEIKVIEDDLLDVVRFMCRSPRLQLGDGVRNESFRVQYRLGNEVEAFKCMLESLKLTECIVDAEVDVVVVRSTKPDSGLRQATGKHGSFRLSGFSLDKDNDDIKWMGAITVADACKYWEGTWLRVFECEIDSQLEYDIPVENLADHILPRDDQGRFLPGTVVKAEWSKRTIRDMRELRKR